MLSLLLFRIILFISAHVQHGTFGKNVQKKSNRVVLCDCCKSFLMTVNKIVTLLCLNQCSVFHLLLRVGDVQQFCCLDFFVRKNTFFLTY